MQKNFNATSLGNSWYNSELVTLIKVKKYKKTSRATSNVGYKINVVFENSFVRSKLGFWFFSYNN